MSREKQTEELAISFHKAIDELLSLQTCRVLAKDFLRLDYRKQIEGEWVTIHTPFYKPTKMICSNCQSLNGARIKFNYCPNCGAKMKGGAE